jgi:hypothetical protein
MGRAVNGEQMGRLPKPHTDYVIVTVIDNGIIITDMIFFVNNQTDIIRNLKNQEGNLAAIPIQTLGLPISQY